MKKEPKKDLRYQKTHDLIRATFQEMLLEMEYHQIMVKDLAERARINRRTFYLHYETIDDLLAEFQEEMGNQFLELIKDYQIPNDIDKIVYAIFQCAESNGYLGEKILCSQGYTSVSHNFLNHVSTETWRLSDYLHGCSQFEQNIIISYLSSSINEIYKQWVADGKKVPMVNVIKLATSLLSQGIYGIEIITP